MKEKRENKAEPETWNFRSDVRLRGKLLQFSIQISFEDKRMDGSLACECK